MDAETPLLENVMTTLGYSLEEDDRPISPSSMSPEKAGYFPKAQWANLDRGKDAPRSNPIAIAHRGSKAKFPENSMSAFIHAISAGAQVIETDLHLSRDGEIVLSHDATLQRCFGVEKRVIDCDWQYLSSLRTIREPFDPMPRLVDLLRYISSAPERKHVRLLLDIKLDNPAQKIMRALADLLRSTAIRPEHKPWNERIILGCWTAKYLILSHTHLPTYPVCLISFSLSYARQFLRLRVPHVIFNLKLEALMGPGGARFLADAQAAGQHVFAWTVNEEALMRWCVRHGLDGVVTDDVEVLRRVCEGERARCYGEGIGRGDGITMRQRVNVFVTAVVLYLAGSVFAAVYPVDLKEFIGGLYQGIEKVDTT
ncbi:glycerophosphoryl diester phosphodiesterase, variant 3 [Blastomyces dermatitidis ER-3]|uniref:Glycerophosphoryl diester phosphodiesterase, variant 1 n=2 Tax=Blastomyces TaxID=229219 RepID=A0A179UW25_BLAGS|nr:glycerophosphoryl diester phosphodiesterase, variant 1 [Blastomyces gilchristii SLH14081]XP_031579791.1 glycerophosphoryl diester phosphodiesterase, variant 2 [Blastomyces gilchristii SLH14081]XP_045280026.1 glycerophosphoryl diester phosphodiesterase, variant 1 [Blastomyces dermatitidis ER-3]XP_045280027.1 glycerophosphoryl diester phosphodiesterase, variant 2 [Blastomyces dermatitidis ER-3]XP_045280028.1 glycerophosphoryl diester phosphodiesterase, variant 3 [Blastomyces dermatitidis ER-3]